MIQFIALNSYKTLLLLVYFAVVFICVFCLLLVMDEKFMGNEFIEQASFDVLFLHLIWLEIFYNVHWAV